MLKMQIRVFKHVLPIVSTLQVCVLPEVSEQCVINRGKSVSRSLLDYTLFTRVNIVRNCNAEVVYDEYKLIA